MKKIGLKVLNAGIAFVLLFSGISGLGDVLLNATEITTANTQNESETTASVGDEETSEVVEETTTEETTVAVEESTAIVEEQTDVIKSAAEESNMAVQAAISEEEQQLLNQLNPRMKSLESEQKDFLTTEDTPESFIVFLKEDQQLYNSATEVFSASAGKSVAPELSTLIVKKDETNLPDEQFINTLSNLSSVESVVKNTVSQMTNYEVSSEKLDTTVVENFSAVDSYGVPNDPLYAYQWEMQQMQMSKVWDLGTGKGVKIGIFDTGFQSAYSDTRGVEFDTNRILPLVKYAENNVCYSHGEHGTMVMSIAGAVKSNNGIGMAGVASGATFQPYMAGYSCSDKGYGMSSANFVKVYEHALANGVNIMNMSFGGPDYEPAENTVIQRATQKGLISVGSRGNDGRESNPTIANYPACYSGVIMVGALTQSNTLADFSSYNDCGNKNLVTAYGAKVITATFDGYWTVNGTSFSAPITAGILAIMKSAKPSATATELKNALLSSATDLGASGYDQKYGYGGINPIAAIQKLDPYVVRVGNYIYYLNTDMTIKYANEYDNNGKKIKAIWYHAGTKIGSQSGKRKNEYFLNADGSGKISYMNEYNTSGKKIKAVWYHAGTKIGSQSGKQKNEYFLNADGSGKISYMNEYNASGKKIKAVWYHAGTKIGSQSGKRKNEYFLNADGSGKISYMNEYNTNGKKIKAVWYHAGTKIGSQSGKQKNEYFLYTDGSGKISYMNEYSTSGKKIKAVWYHAGTKIGSQNGKSQYVYYLYADGSGRISYMSEYNVSGKKVKSTWYKTGTKLGQQKGNEIKVVKY